MKIYLDGEDEPIQRIDYHRKRDGILRIERPSGEARFLTIWERVLYFFGVRT